MGSYRQVQHSPRHLRVAIRTAISSDGRYLMMVLDNVKRAYFGVYNLVGQFLQPLFPFFPMCCQLDCTLCRNLGLGILMNLLDGWEGDVHKLDTPITTPSPSSPQPVRRIPAFDDDDLIEPVDVLTRHPLVK